MPIRKPFKKLSSQSTPAGTYTSPSTPERTPVVHASPVAESGEIMNVSRAAAGAKSNENGFTCVRCLQWFPAGTHHACKPYADVIRNLETPDVKRGPMSGAEIELLQQDGQL